MKFSNQVFIYFVDIKKQHKQIGLRESILRQHIVDYFLKYPVKFEKNDLRSR